MNIFSALERKHCLKEYEKKLAAREYTFAQWEARQPAFCMEEQYEKAAVLYADYIKTDNTPGRKGEPMPVFLPDFSPNRWDFEDYLGEAVFVRKDLYEQVDWDKTSRRMGLKRVMELAVKQSLAAEQVGMQNLKAEQTVKQSLAAEQVGMQKATAKAGADNHVVHIRSMLTQAPTGFVKLDKKPGLGNFDAISDQKLAEAVKQGITIIIPSKDHPEILASCMESVRDTTGDIPLEIIVVDNGSGKQNKVMVTSLCNRIEDSGGGRIRCDYLYKTMDFNFSKMCNMGALKAKGDYLLFLNDDVEAVGPGWLEEMLKEAVKPYTGAVGMKLLYPDGERIQHAGITNLPMGPVHKLQFADDSLNYYDKRNRGVHNVSAVTGACLMIRRNLFDELGGMCEELPVAFNDVALCFEAMKQGYYNVVCCKHHLLHCESISRGQDTTEEKRERLLRERGKLYEMYPDRVAFDPYYPYEAETGYGLCHAYLDTAIRPAYEDGQPHVQKVQGVIKKSQGLHNKLNLHVLPTGRIKQAFPQKKEHEALNPCLKVQVEQLYQETAEYIHVAGYSFVVGSDNCSFAYTLLLRGEEETYAVALQPMRRKDLERNMPDQIHVGLSGFHVQLPAKDIARGRYKVEIYAVDKASSLRLYQSSNVYMQMV